MTDLHYPREYTHGEVIFFGKKFIVTPDVLIPRLETEMLVRRARKILQKNKIDTLVDVGTGSGIIGISCADLVEKLIFTDISHEALGVAEKNFTSHFPEVAATFLQGDLIYPLFQKKNLKGNILIVANLPYIREEDWENMSPDTRFEPKHALFGGEKTGFELYERFFRELQGFFIGMDSCMCLIEFGYDQRDICEEILKKYGWKYMFFSDHAGVERFCEIDF